MKTLIINLLLFTVSCGFAQSFSDSNKKNLLNVLPKKDKPFSYSINGTSADLLYSFKDFCVQSYPRKEDDPTKINSKDASSFFVTLSLSDVNKSYNEFFTDFNQPKLELGFSLAVNKVTEINWNNAAFLSMPFKQWDWYIKLFANNTFSNYYDTSSNLFTHKNNLPFLNYGIQNDFIAYNKRFWIALTTTYTIGMPSENFKPYQEGTSTQLGTSSFYTIGKPSGKYGTRTLNRDLTNGRISVATPIFLGDNDGKGNFIKRNISKLCLIPNYAAYGITNEKWTQLVGISLGLLKNSYNSSDTKSIRISPLLQFGIDWNTVPLESNWSKPNWIMSFKGTIN